MCFQTVSRHRSDPNIQILYDELSKKRPNIVDATGPPRTLQVEEVNGIPLVERIYMCPVTVSSLDLFTGTVLNRFILPIRNSNYSLVTENRISCLFSDFSIHICNTSTQEFIELPDLPSPRTRSGEALGYEPISKTYKIVIFNKYQRGYIFSIRNGGPIVNYWRIIQNVPINNSSFTCSNTCVNGVIYWLVNDKKQSEGHGMRICSFDLKVEVFEMLDIPPGITISEFPKDTIYIMDLNGSLGLVYHSGYSPESNSIWLLSNDKEWIKKYDIDPRGFGHLSRVLGFKSSSSDDDKYKTLLVWMNVEFLRYYNVEDGSFEGIEHVDIPIYKTPSLCYDSLFCLGSYGR